MFLKTGAEDKNSSEKSGHEANSSVRKETLLVIILCQLPTLPSQNYKLNLSLKISETFPR